MNTEENIPQKDQHIRQKLTDFCPDTAWTPAKTWEEIAKKIESEEKEKVIYFYPKTALRVAAVFLLLLGIGGIMWLQTLNQKPFKMQQSHLNTSDKQPKIQKLGSKEEDKLHAEASTEKDKIEPKPEETTYLSKAQKTKREVKISKKDKSAPIFQDTKIKEIPSLEPALKVALEVPQLGEHEPIAKLQNADSPTTQQSPQIVLQVAESAQNNKFSIRIGRRKEQATQEIANTNQKNQKSRIRIQAQPNKDEIQAKATHTEVALLKVRLK